MKKTDHLRKKMYDMEGAGMAALRQIHENDIVWHDHDFFEIVFVLRGLAIHKTWRTKKRIRRGDIIFINRAEPHRYIVESGLEIVNVLVSREFLRAVRAFLPEKYFLDKTYLSRFYAGKPKGYALFSLPVGSVVGVRRILDELLEERKEKRGFESMRRVKFVELLHTTNRALDSKAMDKSAFEAKYSAGIQNTMSYIQSHCRKEMALSDIAEAAGYNASYLSRIFSRSTGYTIVEYITECRIQKACEHLKNPDLSIQEIAYRTGFAATPFFSRTFRVVTGKTPREYRRTTQK